MNGLQTVGVSVFANAISLSQATVPKHGQLNVNNDKNVSAFNHCVQHIKQFTLMLTVLIVYVL